MSKNLKGLKLSIEYKIEKIRNELTKQMGGYLGDYLTLHQTSIEKPTEDDLNNPFYGSIMQRVSKGIEDPKILQQLAYIIASVDFGSSPERERQITIQLDRKFEKMYNNYNRQKPLAEATSRLFFGVPLEQESPLWEGRTIRFTIPPYNTETMIRNMEKTINEWEEEERKEIIEYLSKFYDFHLKVEERIRELAENDDNKPTIHDVVTPEIAKRVEESRIGSGLIISNEIYNSAKKHFTNAIFKPEEYIKEVIRWREALINILERSNEKVTEAYKSLL